MENEIVQFTQDVWKSILGMDVEMCAQYTFPEYEKTLIGFVQITGGWSGNVSVQCTGTLARKVASIMFELDMEKVSMIEIQDALGEMANMVGGNIKSLLPEHEKCFLSLPAVAITEHLRIPGSVIVAKVAFRCGEHFFVVTLQKRGEK